MKTQIRQNSQNQSRQVYKTQTSNTNFRRNHRSDITLVFCTFVVCLFYFVVVVVLNNKARTCWYRGLLSDLSIPLKRSHTRWSTSYQTTKRSVGHCSWPTAQCWKATGKNSRFMIREESNKKGRVSGSRRNMQSSTADGHLITSGWKQKEIWIG